MNAVNIIYIVFYQITIKILLSMYQSETNDQHIVHNILYSINKEQNLRHFGYFLMHKICCQCN